MSDSEQQLFRSMEITERRQAAVQTALQRLAAEQLGLQREREQFARDRRTLEAGMQASVKLAIEQGLRRAASVEAVEAAAKPLLGRLDKVSEGAGRRRPHCGGSCIGELAVAWMGMAGMAGVVLISWLASLGVLWWNMGEIGKIQARKTSLQGDVAQLQAN